jgi:signal transduction histidine kinase
MVLAIVMTGQAYLVVHSAIRAEKHLAGVRPNFAVTELFLNSLAECTIWAFLTVGVFWLGKRFPFGPGKWPLSLVVHVVACFAFAFLQTVLMVFASDFLRRDIPKPSISPDVLFYYFVAKVNNNVFFYWAILALSQIVNYYRRFRERELRASQLEARLAQAQLQLLKAQLHPHFLFNTLNAISALIHQDVEVADRMIARLGDLLRATLENADQQEVALKQELDSIQPYLEIEKARLGERLTVNFDIDPAVMDATVPNLLLQPLVENAIRHGIAPRSAPGRIDVQASRENGNLHLAVADDGPGLKDPYALSQGIGLANTRARLERLYGANQRLELENRPERGLRVSIRIPFQEMTQPSDEDDS